MAEPADDIEQVELAPYARALADGIEIALPGWVQRSVERILVAYHGEADPETMAEAARAGERARAELGPRVRALLELDVDEQRGNPLSVLRPGVRYATEVLHDAGVPPVVRDEMAERQFPDDDYDLTPASFAEIDPALRDPGIEWGAAKALVHRRRHLTPEERGR